MDFTSLKLADLELKGEQKAALNTVASKTIASPSNILPTGFVVLLLVDPCLEKSQESFCHFSSYSIKWRSLNSRVLIKILLVIRLLMTR